MTNVLKATENSPAGNIKTPFNASRWLLLFVYTLQTAITGCVYFGWAPLSRMLLNAGVFADKCERDETGEYLQEPELEGKAFYCNEQDAAVQHLYAITLACHFTTSAVAGLLMDTLGPKCTSVLGQGFNIAGWSLISTLTPHSNLQVYAAFVLIGMGADTAFLPTLFVSRLFPRKPGLIITLLGASSSISFAVPLVLYSLLPTGDLKSCFWYVLFGPGVFLIADALLMPLRPFGEVREKQTNAQDSQDADTAFSGEGDLFIQRSNSSSNALRTEAELEDLGTEKSAGGTNINDSLFQSIVSQKYILIVVYFIGVSWVSAFYQEAHSRLLNDPGPQRFLGWVLPLSCIPCVIFGRCSDWIGILPVMVMVNAAGLLACLCSLWQQPGAGYASALFFMVYMSMFGSQVFIYIERNFPAKHFGRLIGLAELTGGLLSLLCNPLYSAAVDSSSEGYGIFGVQLFLVVLILLEFVVLARLAVLGKRQKNLHSSQSCTVAGGGLQPGEP